MKSSRTRQIASLGLLALVAAACGGPASSTGATGGPGMSDLAPSYDASPDHPEDEPTRRHERRDGTQEGRGDSDRAARLGRSAGSAPAGPPHDGAPGSAAAQPKPSQAEGSASIQDASGDLSASVEGAPPCADIVGVTLTRRGARFEVRTTFAGAVPATQSGGKGMNVASFYDVDGNGMVDYEVWASLADNGWGTGHLDDRRNRATFGPSTGIEVTVEGRTLVTTFPLDRVGGAETFRWSAASEWGSYGSMAASTSARDYAPDDGAAQYPG